MLSKYVKGKVYVFIDIENIFYSQDTLGWKISYEKFMRYIKFECGEKTKCFAYTGIDKNNFGQKKFIDMLDINGYILRTKEVKKIDTGRDRYKWKSNLDVELALEMVKLKDKYDTAVLMSGDSDFAAPIDEIKNNGNRIIVMSTRGRVARELIERAKFFDLRKLRDKVSQ